MSNSDYSVYGSDGLATLNTRGQAPETRMARASDAASRIQTLFYAERQGRTQRRARLKGLVDGNPPYLNSDIRKAGRAQACNVNWRVPEFYLNMGRYAFYEIFAETPTFCTVETDMGETGQREEWSNIITEEFDKLLRSDSSWDRVMQFSIYDMVLYGCGPLVFPDEHDWRNQFIPCSDLILPDFASSDPNQWEEAVIARNYTPTELYGFIRNEERAKELGWDVEATKKAIMQAHTFWQQDMRYKQWEWHQQQLKNNAFWYNATARVIQIVHYYFREFQLPGEKEGKITHTILINPEDNQTVTADGSRAFQDNYLYRRLRRFNSWNEIIHPMYYDNDGGGYHHSVTGLGVKMYSAMEYQNRLICNVADKAFAPKILFRPLTANNDQQMNIVQYAEFGKVPSNYEVLQTPVQSFMEEGIGLNRELTNLISGNLAQYRTGLSRDGGNPITAYEAQVRTSEQSRLGRTQLNHYYNQLDWLFSEKYRRATNPKLNGFMPGGTEAVLFRNACLRRGVPAGALTNVRFVKATRTVGQGSQFLRQQSLQQILAISGMLPEGGRMNVVDDYIASIAGQSMVNRYAPKQETKESIDQLSIATLQIAAAKDGIQPIVGGSQNHYIFARAFLQAASQSLMAVQQGANPAEAVAFNKTIGPSLMAHIMALESDPTREKEAKEMMRQAQQVERMTNQLAAQLQAQAEKQAQARQRMGQQESEAQHRMRLDQMEVQHKLSMSEAKTRSQIQTKEAKTQQDLAIRDAVTASDINRKNAEAAASAAAPIE